MYFNKKNKIIDVKIKINFIFFSKTFLLEDFNENVLRGLIKSNENTIVAMNKKFTLDKKDTTNSFFSYTIIIGMEQKNNALIGVVIPKK